MKKFCCVAVLMIAGSISAPAFAKDISEFSVGDIGCYDRLGPFNVIGRVVDINRSKEEILLENEKGKWTCVSSHEVSERYLVQVDRRSS